MPLESTVPLSPSTTATAPPPRSSKYSEAGVLLVEGDEAEELARLRREVKALRVICKDHPDLVKGYYYEEAFKTLRNTVFFQDLNDDQLRMFAKKCQRRIYQPGDVLAREGEPWEQPVKFFSSGEVERWTEVTGVHVKVRSLDNASLGTMHLLLDEPTRFNVAAETEVISYELSKKDFDEIVRSEPMVMFPIAQALAKYIRGEHRAITSGLLHQRGIVQKHEKSAYTATALAVFVEAFYRSAMNNVLNAQLDGKPIGPITSWFPSMHIQIPVRIFYITGLKEIRRKCNDIDYHAHRMSQDTWAVLSSFMPGVAMSPFSSVLEATHSGQNKEPMWRRWTRGYMPRLVREILFGIGINQLSDYCREHMPASVENQHVRLALGSISSGIIAGYLSQIPHNISTMKLMSPKSTYGELWSSLWKRSIPRVPRSITEPTARATTAQMIALFLPLGCVRRSAQIAGSFIIINGLLYNWRDKEWP